MLGTLGFKGYQKGRDKVHSSTVSMRMEEQSNAASSIAPEP